MIFVCCWTAAKARVCVGVWVGVGVGRPERGPEIPEIPEILKSVLKCPEIH